jgi:hypothetical protein
MLPPICCSLTEPFDVVLFAWPQANGLVSLRSIGDCARVHLSFGAYRGSRRSSTVSNSSFTMRMYGANGMGPRPRNSVVERLACRLGPSRLRQSRRLSGYQLRIVADHAHSKTLGCGPQPTWSGRPSELLKCLNRRPGDEPVLVDGSTAAKAVPSATGVTLEETMVSTRPHAVHRSTST